MRAGAIVLLAALLAGCGEAAPDPAPSDAMTMAPEVRNAKGTGTVSAVDVAAGKVTLDHDAMPDLGWPAMTMGFKADPDFESVVRDYIETYVAPPA